MTEAGAPNQDPMQNQDLLELAEGLRTALGEHFADGEAAIYLATAPFTGAQGEFDKILHVSRQVGEDGEVSFCATEVNDSVPTHGKKLGWLASPIRPAIGEEDIQRAVIPRNYHNIRQTVVRPGAIEGITYRAVPDHTDPIRGKTYYIPNPEVRTYPIRNPDEIERLINGVGNGKKINPEKQMVVGSKIVGKRSVRRLGSLMYLNATYRDEVNRPLWGSGI